MKANLLQILLGIMAVVISERFSPFLQMEKHNNKSSHTQIDGN
jgi:hypothetical protein